MTSGSPRRRFVLAALAFLVWAGAMWGGSAYFTRRAAKGDRELPVYVMGGERLAAGEEIYRRGADAKPFTYPPFAAVPFVPFSWLPRDWQPAAWFVVNFHLLLGIVLVLQRHGRRRLEGRGPPRMVGFWLLTLFLGGHHVASVFSNQSHDLLIAGLAALTFVGWARAARGGGVLAAVWVGIGAAIKATPLLFLGLFLVRYRWLAAVVVVAAFGLLSWSPDLLFPRADGGSWFKAWIDVNLRGLEVGGTASAAGAWNAHSYLNQSLSGTLTRLFTPAAVTGAFVDESAMLIDLGATGCKIVTVAGQLAVLGLLTGAVRSARQAVLAAESADSMQRTVALGEIAVFVCGMVLLSPQSSKAHFCIWLFPAAYLADRMLRGPRDRLLWPLAIAAFVVGPLMSKGVVGREFGNLLLARGNVTWATVLLLLATVRSLRTGR
ncbi:MAG: DUF2029 domain-containing protein [bacterium]|nr:DUF2029 domain-containing protein [bacterium]